MIKAVIFDVDGVLLDSFNSNYDFYLSVMKEAGYGGFTKEKYVLFNHLTLREAMSKLSCVNDYDEVERIYNIGLKLLSSPDNDIKMFDGASRVIKTLKKNYSLGIVSSRIKSIIFEGELKDFKDFFSVAVGYEDTSLHKPHPEPLLLAAKKLGVEPNECVYVGDAITDVQAAVAAGMKIIFFGKEKPRNAVFSAKNFDELYKVIKKL